MRRTRSSSKEKKQPAAEPQLGRRTTRSRTQVTPPKGNALLATAVAVTATQEALPMSTEKNEESLSFPQTPPKLESTRRIKPKTPLSNYRVPPQSPLITGIPTKAKKTRRRSRMSLEQSIHHAKVTGKESPGTSTVVEADENSSYQKSTPPATPEKNGDALFDEAATKEAEYKKRLKHTQRLWRERGHWKKIIRDVSKMSDVDFLQKYCADGLIAQVDVEACYAEAEANVLKFIEQTLTEKYGPEVKTLQNREDVLKARAAQEAYDHEKELEIQYAQYALEMHNIMKFDGRCVIEL